MAKDHTKEQVKEKTSKQEQAQKNPKKYKCTSHMIEVFEHEGKRYTIYPNTIVENLPEDAEPVKKLIKKKKLVEVK